jgi:hypothetical protein
MLPQLAAVIQEEEFLASPMGSLRDQSVRMCWSADRTVCVGSNRCEEGEEKKIHL